MCHNAELVLRPDQMPALPEEEVWAFLARRQGLVDGVVISGGEPTLQRDLPAFLGHLRERHLDVKLDTNGYHPDVLARLLDENLVDYVALDIKAPPDKYALLAGTSDMDVGRVERSVALLREHGVAYELRTTVVPAMLNEGDVETLARWVAPVELYVLQQFQSLGTLDPTLERVSPYAEAVLGVMAERAARWLPRVEVRAG